MDEIQMLLGLPRLDRTKTRQLVRACFQLYRQYKWLLEMDMEPHREPPAAKSGYENAMDPRLIHANRVYPDGPNDHGDDIDHSSIDEARRSFCLRVERKVNHLRDYQRDIILHHYMYPYNKEQPTNDETYLLLQKRGWYVGKRYYEQEKAKALWALAYSFGVQYYRR